MLNIIYFYINFYKKNLLIKLNYVISQKKFIIFAIKNKYLKNEKVTNNFIFILNLSHK